MNNYNYDDNHEDTCNAEASLAFIRLLAEKEERNRPLREVTLTEDILRMYNFYLFDLENLEGSYIEGYGKINNEIDLESSSWAVNDLFTTGKTLPGIDPRTGVYGPVIASMGFTHAGNEYTEREEYEKAIANYTKAIEINPRNIQAFLGRGVARFHHIGEPKYAAIEDLWDAVDMNPLRIAEKNKQSRAVLKLLDNESMQDLRLCLAESLTACGAAFLNAGMLDEALENFSEAIKYDPGNYELYIHRGAVHKLFGCHEEAAADHTQALCLEPDFAPAYAYRASAYIGLRKYREAIADYNKKLSMSPGTAYDYINRALCFSKLLDKPRAVADAEMALRMDPSNREILRCRDNIYREMERRAKAIIN